jgi:hypothetical protein
VEINEALVLDETEEMDSVGAGFGDEVGRGRTAAVDETGDQTGIALAVVAVDLREEGFEAWHREAVLHCSHGIDLPKISHLADHAQITAGRADSGIAPDLRLRLAKAVHRFDAIQKIVAPAGLAIVRSIPRLRLFLKERANLFRDLGQRLIDAVSLEAGERLTISRPGLDAVEPRNLVPPARADDHRKDRHPLPAPPLQELGNFLAEDELRGQKIGGDKEHSDAGASQRVLNILEPIRSTFNAAVVPDIEPLRLEDTEMRPQAVLPGFVLVAVAQEDGGHGRSLRRAGQTT